MIVSEDPVLDDSIRSAPPPRRRLRAVVTGLMSAVVVTGVAGTLVAPTSAAFATSVSVSKSHIRGEVIYGQVTNDGKPVKGARITLLPGRNRHHPAHVRTNRHGDFRAVLPAAHRSEEVAIRYGRVHGHVHVTVNPRHAYRVDARIVDHHSLFFLPIFSY